ncbi:ECF transporter S component [Mycoplasmatota bacterium WC30]
MKKVKVFSNKEKTREMTILAMFIAIIAVMGFVPWLGFIPIFGLSATIIHVPVLIGGTLLGRKSSIILGLAFGVISMLRAFTSVGFDYVFIFPWVSVLPRFIFGLVIYDVVRLFRKLIKNRLLAFGAAFLILSLIHSLLVLPMMVSTFPIILGNASMSSIVGGDATTFMEGIDSFKAVMSLIWGILISNSIVEAGLAAVIGGIVTDRLVNYMNGRNLIKDYTGGLN